MKSTVIQFQNWLSKSVGLFKSVLIILVVVALLSTPYSFDLNKGKITVSYAIAKDGDDDDGSSGTSGKGSSDSGDSEGLGGRGRGSVGVGGVQGLTPVSAEDEADLVGNWGEPESK